MFWYAVLLVENWVCCNTLILEKVHLPQGPGLPIGIDSDAFVVTMDIDVVVEYVFEHLLSSGADNESVRSIIGKPNVLYDQ